MSDANNAIRLEVVQADEAKKAASIQILETALEEAKAGSGFDSVMILATSPDGVTRELWTAGMSKHSTVGRLEAIKWSIMHQPFEDEPACR